LDITSPILRPIHERRFTPDESALGGALSLPMNFPINFLRGGRFGPQILAGTEGIPVAKVAFF
jgi:hypothetical protein